jgi:hypothetical protein
VCAGLGVVVVAALMLIHPGSTFDQSELQTTYVIHFDNLTVNVKSTGTLTHLHIDGNGGLTGSMTVNPPLYGTGPLTGHVASGSVAFSGAQQGAYQGRLGPDEVITGTYTYPNQHGTWQANPSNPPKPQTWPPLWLWLLLLALLIALAFSLARLTHAPHD